MIPFAEALARMLAAADPLPTETVDLAEAEGRILAQDVHADRDLPPFAKAAMDGYACRRADLTAGAELVIIEEIPAGAWPTRAIGPGTCARILTGAPLPTGADLVLMQEQTERHGDRVRIVDPASAANFCPRGEDLGAGDLVLSRGTRLGPAALGVLASIGAVRPLVARRPRVAILATGSELVDGAATPGPAQIRNSNSPQLAAQVRSAGALAESLPIVADTGSALREAIEGAAAGADLVLLSGGVSTGDYDLVPGVLRAAGFALEIESVAMQPGRPLVFGRRGDVCCCGLPGNPVSTFVVFELLVRPFLLRRLGHEHRPTLVRAILAEGFRRRRADRQATLPLRFRDPATVEAVDYHGSGHLNALIATDGLLLIPVGTTTIPPGTAVDVRLLST
jgi:molybdopterin molybdotransferase